MYITNEAYADAAEATVEENLGLVRLCAGRFRGKGIEYEELYSAGCMGLVKAVKAFDSGRGVRFSTYAVPVILGEIRRLFRDGATEVSNTSANLGGVDVGKLFDRFFSVEAARNSTGLGLAISKALVEQMGGSIGARMDGDLLTIRIEWGG